MHSLNYLPDWIYHWTKLSIENITLAILKNLNPGCAATCLWRSRRAFPEPTWIQQLRRFCRRRFRQQYNWLFFSFQNLRMGLKSDVRSWDRMRRQFCAFVSPSSPSFQWKDISTVDRGIISWNFLGSRDVQHATWDLLWARLNKGDAGEKWVS